MMVPFPAPICYFRLLRVLLFRYLIGIHQVASILDNLEGGILPSRSLFVFLVTKICMVHGWRSLWRGLAGREVLNGSWARRMVYKA
jgi:hypothetical protein